MTLKTATSPNVTKGGKKKNKAQKHKIRKYSAKDSKKVKPRNA